jgi:hypothetical protein
MRSTPPREASRWRERRNADPVLGGQPVSKKMECNLFRNGQLSGAVVIEFEDDIVTRGRFGTFSIRSVDGWLKDDQLELQPPGGNRIPIALTKNVPSSKGIVVDFCSYLDKWE